MIWYDLGDPYFWKPPTEDLFEDLQLSTPRVAAPRIAKLPSLGAPQLPHNWKFQVQRSFKKTLPSGYD